MSGANIFVMYTSGDGKNVTISPRLGTGHVMPQHDTAANVTLLAGSGVNNGVMTANVKCSNCNSWTGGTMDFNGSSSDWIYAYKSGSAMNSDDQTSTIRQHDSASHFTWSLADAKGGSDVNPFTSSSTTSSSSSTANSANSTSSNHDGPPGFDNDGPPFGGDAALGNRVIMIHGALASLAFVGLFPIGGILIRIASFTGLIWVHAALQIVAYVIYFLAFGMGVYLMRNLNNTISSHTHPALGGILFIVLLSQPVTGFIHHRMFKKRGRRTGWSHVHLFIGRIAIVLGIINGGLGINLAGDVSIGGKVAYGIFAGIMLIAYIASIVIGEMRLRTRLGPPNFAPNQQSQVQSRRLSFEEGADGSVQLQERFPKR